MLPEWLIRRTRRFGENGARERLIYDAAGYFIIDSPHDIDADMQPKRFSI